MGADAPAKGSDDSHRGRDPAKRSFLSKLFFLFVDPLVNVGYKRTLEPEDLLELESVRTAQLYKNFDDAWGKELKKEKPDIKRAVVAGSATSLIFSGLLFAVSNATTLAGPLLLNRIVGGLSCYATGRPNCEPQSQLY